MRVAWQRIDPSDEVAYVGTTEVALQTRPQRDEAVHHALRAQVRRHVDRLVTDPYRLVSLAGS